MTPIIIFMVGAVISFCLLLILTDYYDTKKEESKDFIKNVQEYMEELK